MITRTFKLCLNAGTGSAPYINVSQYDEGETWLFELYSETGERYIPSTGAIVGVKSDGHGIVNTGTVDNEGRVVITETQQMTASAGRAIFELSIDGLTHGTANFIVAVERKPTDEAVMSDSDLSLIQQAVDSAEVIVEVIGDSDPSEVIGEHVDDWLDNHPEATTTVVDGAITAPKLNQSLWDKLLVSESASGAVASFDDGADDVPVSSLKVNLEPIQTGSGDPSPSNVRPIIAANGLNILKLTARTVTAGGVTYSVASDGAITLTGTCTSNQSFTIYTGQTVPRTGWYTCSTYGATNGKVNGASSASQMVNAGTSPSGFAITVASGTTYNETFYLMLNEGNTAQPYQPYQGIMVERCGKNLYPYETIPVYTYGWYSDYSFSGTPNKVFLKGGTSYMLSFETTASSQYVNIRAFDKLGNLITSNAIFNAHQGNEYLLPYSSSLHAFRLSAAVTYKWVRIEPTTDVYIGIVMGQDFPASTNAQLERGTTATDYEPYTSTSYPYTLGQNVYGGSVDLATGVLTVDRVLKVFDGSATTGWESIATYGDVRRFDYTNADILNRDSGGGVICNYLPNGAIGTSNLECCNVHAGSSIVQIQIKTSRLSGTTVADLMTYFQSNPIQLCYKLATPTTVQLTPTEVKTLLGYNNISSSGTVEVIYHADTKLYVDKMTNVDNAIIAPTEEGFTASRNYTVNDLVIVNDTLYKVTANIASGSTITPNSNVQQTTLSALIKALS